MPSFSKPFSISHLRVGSEDSAERVSEAPMCPSSLGLEWLSRLYQPEIPSYFVPSLSVWKPSKMSAPIFSLLRAVLWITKATLFFGVLLNLFHVIFLRGERNPASLASHPLGQQLQMKSKQSTCQGKIRLPQSTRFDPISGSDLGFSCAHLKAVGHRAVLKAHCALHPCQSWGWGRANRVSYTTTVIFNLS